MLRFYFKIDPELLDDNEWISKVTELTYALDFEGKMRSTNGTINMPCLR